MKIDLHSHSQVSDGLDTPAELVRNMANAGIGAFALTDHDTLQGIPEARQAAEALGLELIPGAEISAQFAGHDDVHILGLFLDETSDGLVRKLTERQENRRRRGERMAEKLVAAGYPLDLEAIRRDVGDGVWGRPHLARALIRAGHARTNDEAFERFLGHEHPWYVATEKWDATEVVRAIREAGGLSSLAHPIWYAGAEEIIRGRDPVWYAGAEEIIRGLAAAGLDAVEVFHPDQGPEEEARLGSLTRELGLAATAGSDFHGVPEGRKHPGGVVGDGEMLGILRARLSRG